MMTGTTLFLPTYPTMPHITSPHCKLSAPGHQLLLERIAILLNHRVGQHFACNALHLGLCIRLRQPVLQGDLEVLALADFIEPLVAHLFERALDSFALRIEHALLQRHVYVGFHGTFIIRQVLWNPASAASTEVPSSQFSVLSCQ